MRLKRIELKNFKRFLDFQAQFSPGINVIKGPLNEMGKSTLLDGIVVALFYNPKSTAKWLREYVSWGSTKQCRTCLEFENNGNKYLLEKDFDKGTARLIGENGREELDTFKEISAKMEEFLGTNSDRLFLCTSCIRQAEVRAISSGKKEISESLEEVVTGGKESTLASEVIQKLDDKISEMKKGLDRPAKIPGILASRRGQLEDSSRKCIEVRKEVSKLEAQKIELMEVNRQLAEIKEEYEKSKALLEKNKQRKEIETSIENFKQKYKEVETLISGINMLMGKSEEANQALKSIEGVESQQQVAQVRAGIDEVKTKRETIMKDAALRKKELEGAEGQVAGLKAKLVQVEQALRSIDGFETSQQVSELKRRLDITQIRSGDVERDLINRENEVAMVKDKPDERRALKFLGSKQGIASAVVICIIGIAGTLLGPLYLLSLIILGMVFLAAAMWAARILAQERTKTSDLEERIQRMKEVLEEVDKERTDLLAEVKCNTVAEFDKKEKDFHYWLGERSEQERQLTLLKAKASDLEERIQGMGKAIEELNSQEKSLLAQVKCNTVEEFREKEKNFHHWVEEKKKYDNQLKGKLEGKTLGEIEQQRSEIIRDLRVMEDRLTEDLLATRLSPEGYIELERKVRSLEEKQAELQDRKKYSEAVIKLAKEKEVDAEKQIKLEEEVDSLQEALKQEEKRVKIYELAKEFISKARAETLLAANEVLEKEIQNYFSVFTNGKYKQVKINKEALEFWVYSDEKRDWAKPEELSGGVIDEFYLAFRLALARLIFGDKKPPLILDDPFVNFDSVRLANTLNFFKTLASDYQIIIFTLSNLYDKVADNIILLSEKERLL